MEWPRLLPAFQEEYDRRMALNTWPREFTDPIRDLRHPREAGARAAERALRCPPDKAGGGAGPAAAAAAAATATATGQPRRIRIEDVIVPPGEDGGPPLQVTVVAPYEEEDPARRRRDRPCIFFIHGGAMCGSSRHVGLHVNGPAWADEGIITVSVEYRRAPENRGEGLARDCYRVLRWVWESLEFDHDRLMVYGASAGGCLAAATVLLLVNDQQAAEAEAKASDPSDEPGQPPPPHLPRLCGLFLEAPMLDHRCDSESMRSLDSNGPFFNGQACRFAWQQVLQDEPVVTKYMAPALATREDLARFPPTAAYVGNMDPLYSELEAWMAVAGRDDFVYRVFEGLPHGFDAMLPEEEVSREAKLWRLNWIQARFGISKWNVSTLECQSLL